MATAKKASPAAKKPAAKKPAAKKPAAKTAGTLYSQVVGITGLSADANESMADYAVRACDAISKLDDDAYGALPKGVVKWLMTSVDPINKNDLDALPELTGFTAPSTSTGSSKKAATSKTPKKGKTAGEGDGRGGPRTDSMAYKIRLAVVKNGTEVAFDFICKKAGVGEQERGSNAWNAYFNAVQVLRIAAAEGMYSKA